MNRLLYLSFVAAVMTLCLFSGLVFAQEDFYYSRDEKIPLTISTEKISIKFKSGVTQSQIQSLLSSEPILGELKPLRTAVAKDFFTVRLKNCNDVKQLLQILRKRPEVDIVNPVYVVEGLEAISFDHFIVQFKPSVTGTEIEALNRQHHVEIVDASKASPNLYTFRVSSASDLSVVEMGKLYYESLPSEWSLPDFIVPIELFSIPNDTYFQYQYYFHNTGQTGGVPDADIDAPEAWDISKGSSSIIVAVIDEGGASHEDLPSGRIVAGYDYVYLDTDPSPGGNEAHGMACAGIIGASHNNNLGVSGLAQNCMIMPIRIFDEWGYGTSINNVANSIDYSWQNGAHVISGSWGYGTSNPNHPLLIPIRDAINRALTQGRGEKGTVAVFAAGNTANRSSGDYGYVAFPACVPGVIAVGATDKNNNIQNYSPRDTELAVVAPSGDLGYLQPDNSIKLKGDVWSMDVTGHPGWNKGDYGTGSPTYYVHYTWNSPGGDSYPPGNYTARFGGTSVACPQASGVSALLLTVNPNLTASQVKSIIQNSANDMGAQGYDTDYGYGRVNAYKALKYTLENYGGTLTQNLTIPSDESWNFQPGVTVKFPSGYSLVVNGTLMYLGHPQAGQPLRAVAHRVPGAALNITPVVMAQFNMQISIMPMSAFMSITAVPTSVISISPTAYIAPICVT